MKKVESGRAGAQKRRTSAGGRHALHRYHHGNLSNVVVKAALAHIARNGAHSLSLREIARAAGVSHASVYRHFRNKESVLATIAEQGFRILAVALGDAARRHPDDPLLALRATGAAYVQFGTSHARYLQVMFGDLIENHDLYPALKTASQDAYGVLVSVIHDGQRRGLIKAHHDRTVAAAAWALVHGLALLMASGSLRTDGQPTETVGFVDSVLVLLQVGVAAT